MLRQMPRRTPNMSAMSPARENFLKVMIWLLSVDGKGAGSQRGDIGLAGADAHGAVDAEDEDLSVSDLARFGGAGDCFDHLVDLLGVDCHFDLDLGQEAHGVFGAAIDFGVALL